MPRARTPQLIVIYWRDIPSQVNGSSGGEKHQVLLKPRFEKAIDRAAMKAGLTQASDYVNEWRREARPTSGDIVEGAKGLAAELEAAFPLEVLDQYVAAGGFDPNASDQVDSGEGTAAQGADLGSPEPAGAAPTNTEHTSTDFTNTEQTSTETNGFS